MRFVYYFIVFVLVVCQSNISNGQVYKIDIQKDTTGFTSDSTKFNGDTVVCPFTVWYDKFDDPEVPLTMATSNTNCYEVGIFHEDYFQIANSKFYVDDLTNRVGEFNAHIDIKSQWKYTLKCSKYYMFKTDAGRFGHLMILYVLKIENNKYDMRAYSVSRIFNDEDFYSKPKLSVEGDDIYFENYVGHWDKKTKLRIKVSF